VKGNEAIRGVANKVIELAHTVKHSAVSASRSADTQPDDDTVERQTWCCTGERV